MRYINADNNIAGPAIDMIEAKADRSAKRLLKIMDTSLKDNYLNCGSIASQCYDGTSVMSGREGGLQKLLSDKCGRSILSKKTIVQLLSFQHYQKSLSAYC